jgi:Uma2 family endonuclease
MDVAPYTERIGLMSLLAPLLAPPPPDPGETDLPGPRSRRGTPTWELAHLFPRQGDWTEEDYFKLEAEQRIEYLNGCLVFLPMPTRSHELIVQFLFRLLDQYVQSHRLGRIFFSGYRVLTVDTGYRLPDLFFLRAGRKEEERAACGADVVFEVLSPGQDNRERDLEEKRAEYAAAGIPEYWIVDPEQRTIPVLTLDGDHYRAHGAFKPGETATSVLLSGFSVDVAACFAAVEAVS